MRSFAVVVLASLALVVSASSQQRGILHSPLVFFFSFLLAKAIRAVAELYILNAAHTVKDTAVHTVASEDLSGKTTATGVLLYDRPVSLFFLSLATL